MKPIKTILALLMVLFYASANGQETHQYDFVVDGWGYSKGYYYHFDGPPTYDGDTTKLTLEGSNKDFTGIFTIPEMVEGYPVTQIAGGAGGNCNLSGLVIPNSVTWMNYGAFCSCPNLESVVLSDNISRVYESFQNCPALRSIYFGKTYLESVDAFTENYGSGNLVNHSVTEITWNAINGLLYQRSFPNLQTLTLGNAVQTIPENFLQLTQISTLAIPASVKTIGAEAFVGSSKLSSISVAAGNKNYDSRDDCQAIISKATDELILGCSTTVIPATVKSIGDKAFLNSPIEEISIPGSVSDIGISAFRNCTNLKHVELNEGLKTINSWAFASCEGNEEIVFPSTITNIGGEAFGQWSSLKRIYLKSPRPAVITSGAYDTFEGVDKDNCILYVPKGSLQTYWSTSGWNEFAHIEEYDPENGQPLKGDVNGDGKVNVSDVTALINIILHVQ